LYLISYLCAFKIKPMVKKVFTSLVLTAIFILSHNVLLAQNSIGLNGQDTTRRVITTAVPFIGFAPDSRASGMGDAGVATTPDANSVHWNNGKLAFIEADYGVSLSYTPWLGKLVNDMSLNYLSGFYKIDRVQTIAVSLRYFDLGEIQLTGDSGNGPIDLGIENPREMAVDATYSRKLSESIGIGVTARYIWSNVAGSLTGTPGAKSGKSVAVDLGFYYTKQILISGRNTDLSFGAHISNIGAKVTYSTEGNADFIPTNLRLGTAIKTSLDPFNTLTFVLDFNKLLVPTPPVYALADNGAFILDNNGDRVIARGRNPDRNLISGMIGSFYDAPDGFSEEMQEIMISVGMEYWYRELFAARVGYFYEAETKGGRKYFTAGLGFRYQKFGLDFSYLIPTKQNHPLAETIRFTLLFNFSNGTEDADDSSN